MEHGQPSRTAMGAAIHRAAHQLLEGGSLWADPLAVKILGPGGEALAREAGGNSAQGPLRHFIALRARFAEEALAAAYGLGFRQGLLLGAGLDTFAYRNPLGEDLRLFEVDHPATQAWKRRRLAEAGLLEPANLAFVPVDFERDGLVNSLGLAGFEPSQPVFCSWLGVVPYLTEAAIYATLAELAAMPGGVRMAFDYGNPPELRPGLAGPAGGQAALAKRVAGVGEPIRTYFATEHLHAELRGLGFQVLEDLGPAGIRERYGREGVPGAEALRGEARSDGLRLDAGLGAHGGHFLLASTG